ncbi:hypothetical protein BACCIP111895_00848 [Neobacillus rhizosphaerae]|uniref:DUF2975 domain-containing protein n=1 Tax=Neobacillus rhizosphaerae TaxID=2880965 RepID=A0ABN8KJR3_9BACI|nr:DUF2975 domain-containing protein [Neobacillus rhizosphaerae]CAH2713694.1 hypothetical protein BACCIP111895_00848 [Neobacillus rhizosphaerae]
MELVIEKKNFKVLIKGLNMIFTALLIVLSCLLLFFGALIVFASLISENFVLNLIEGGKFSASFNFSGFELFLAEPAIKKFHYDKGIIVLLLFIVLIYISIIFYIIILVKKFLNSIMQGEIFTLSNSKRIEKVAYCFVSLSFVINTIQTYLIYALSQLFTLEQFMESANWIKSVSYHFFGVNWSMFLCGLIIWTIGRIFRYGSFLQEEFDATL